MMLTFTLCPLIGAPTAEQQYMLELVNQMRTNPAAQLERYVNLNGNAWAALKSDDAATRGSLDQYGVSAAALVSQWAQLQPTQALAWNDSLGAAASGYSNLMVFFDQQQHNLGFPLGQTLEQQFINAGYNDAFVIGQNLYATAQNAFHAHTAIAIDWADAADALPGTGMWLNVPHRELLMDGLAKEIGIGFQTLQIPNSNVNVRGTGLDPNAVRVTTQYLGGQVDVLGSQEATSHAFLTGVIYQDGLVLDDDFYTVGEGVGGATLLIYQYDGNGQLQLVATGNTNAVGGINVELAGLTDASTYRVEAPSVGLAQDFTLARDVIDIGTAGNPYLMNSYRNVYLSFIAPVPEPGSLSLLALAFLLWRRRGR